MLPTSIGGIDNNPYGLDHWKVLRETQGRLAKIAILIDKAERCNISCADLRAVHDGLAESLERIQGEFFNPPPMGELGG